MVQFSHVSALLRCNLYTIKFTDVKYTVQRSLYTHRAVLPNVTFQHPEKTAHVYQLPLLQTFSISWLRPSRPLRVTGDTVSLSPGLEGLINTHRIEHNSQLLGGEFCFLVDGLFWTLAINRII